VPVLSPAAAALPLVFEIFYDAVGSDNGRSFVQLAGEPDGPADVDCRGAPEAQPLGGEQVE